MHPSPVAAAAPLEPAVVAGELLLLQGAPTKAMPGINDALSFTISIPGIHRARQRLGFDGSDKGSYPLSTIPPVFFGVETGTESNKKPHIFYQTS